MKVSTRRFRGFHAEAQLLKRLQGCQPTACASYDEISAPATKYPIAIAEQRGPA